MFAQAPAGLSITNYQMVNETFYSRTQSYVTYRADLRNTGSAQTSVTATVVSLVSSIQVKTGQDVLHFSPVPANSQVAASETFTILVDRTAPFDFNNLQWTFQTPAPPAPVANAGADQSARVGQVVTLNGGASTNPSAQGTLTYTWVFTSRPAGSAAVLNNATAVSPTFVPDVAGTYALTLTVNNGVSTGSASTTVSTTAPPPPVAKAGADQTVNLNATVVLNGSGSTSGSGNALTYAWSLPTVPTGSTAVLTGATTVSPTFVADKAGNYIAQLIVNDGIASSTSSTVTISTQVVKPVANAGTGQVVNVNSTVQLNGAASTDANGLPLTYKWSFTTLPQGSAAVIGNTSAVNPTFAADRPGTYIAQLIVNNGALDSTASTVTITTNPILAPTANPGVNQTVQQGTTVQLSGSGTDPQNLSLTYQWSINNKPAGSSAALSSSVIANPTFVADQVGTYIAQLVVLNGFQSSAPATVTISTVCAPPTANAGSNQNVVLGATVQLSGSASGDVCHDPLTYLWSLTSRPAGSTATLSSSNTVSPSFVPDTAGTFVAQLIVNNGFANSTPVTVTITVANPDIMIPANLTVGVGLSTTFSVVLANPAPATGVFIQFTSSDPSVTVTPSSIIITVGNTTTVNQPKVNGIAFGSAIITATADHGLAPAHSSVQVVLGTLSFTTPTLTINGAGSRNLTLAITPPSTTAVTVNLSSSDPSVASVSSTVTIPANASSVAVPVNAIKNGSATIHASGANLPDTTASLTVVIPSQISLPANPSVGLGQTIDYPVSLTSAAPANGVTVTFATDPLKVTITPSSIFFAEGATLPDAQPRVTGVLPGSANISATAPTYTTANGTIQVTASISFAGGLTLAPGENGNLTLNLSGATPTAGFAVNITSGTPGSVTVSALATIPAGLTSVQVPVAALAQGTSIVTASASNVADATATVTVTAGSITVPTNPSVALGNSIAFPITLSAPAAADLTVALSSSAPAKVSIPATVVILKNATTPATQPQITGAHAGSATITVAADGYTTATQTVQVNATLAFAGSLNLDTASSGNLTLNLTTGKAPSDGLVINLISDKTNFATVPDSVTIPAGQTTVSVPVQGVAVGVATITASSSGISNAATTVTVGNPASIVLPSAPTVGLGQSATFAISLSKPAPADLTVSLSSSDATKVSIPASVVVLKDATAPVTQPQITGAGAGSATITASATGYASATVSVPVTVTMSFPAPLTIAAENSGNLVLTLSGGQAPSPNGLTITLVSGNQNFATVPQTVTIAAGQTSVNVPVTGVAKGQTSITATSANIATATGSVTVNDALAINLPTSPAVGLGQSTAFAISLSVPAAADVTINLSSSDSQKVSIPASVVILKNATTPATQPQITGTGAGSATITASATGYTTATVSVPVTVSMAFAGPITFPAKTSGTLVLSLTGGQAPTGDLTINLVSGNPSFATVPDSVKITAGHTSVNITVTGVAPGQTTITASSPNIANAVANVTIGAPLSLQVPATTAVQLGKSATFAVALSQTAAADVVVALSSDNPKIIVPTSVVVPQGQTSPAVQPQVSGLAAGSATITATATGYLPASGAVQVSAGLAFAANLTLNAEGSGSLTLNLTGGVAPTPDGLVVALLSDKPGVASVGQSVTIAAGASTIQVPVSAVAQGTATITASSTNITAATATVTVNPKPSIALTGGSVILGASANLGVTLSAPALAPVTITLVSSDPTKATVTGSVTIAANQTQPASAAVINGLAAGSVNITASASGYTGSVQPVQISIAPVLSFTSGTLNIAPVFPNTGTLTLRLTPASATPVTVTLSSNSQKIFVPVTVTIPALQTDALVLVSATDKGPATIVATVGTLAASATVTTTPTLQVSSINLGQNLQSFIRLTILGDPAPEGGISVNVTISDPTKLLLGNGLQGGSLLIQANTNSLDVGVQALDSTGTVSINASALGYISGSGQVKLFPSGFVLSGPNGIGQPFTVGQGLNPTVSVMAFRLDESLNVTADNQAVRSGALKNPFSIKVSLTSSPFSVGVLSPSSVTFAGGDQKIDTHLQTFNTGSTTLSVITPSGFSPVGQGASTLVATVTQVALSPSDVTVGKGLEAMISVQLTGPVQADSSMTVTSNDPSKVLFSATPDGIGSSSISIPLTAGAPASPDFFVYGLTTSGQATYSASSPGYLSGNGTVTLAPSGIILQGPGGLGATSFLTTVENGDSNLKVISALLQANTNSYVAAQNVAGGNSVSVNVTSSNQAIGTITTSPVIIAPGTGLATTSFHPVAPDVNTTTTLAVNVPVGFSTPSQFRSIDARVVATSMSITGDSGNPVIIGQNLEESGTIILPAPVTSNVVVTLTSNSPALLKLSNTAGGAGSQSITVTIPAGSMIGQYYVQAFGNSGTGTATYTGSATGYASRIANQITMVPSGVVITGPFGFQRVPPPANFILTGGPQALTVSVGKVNPGDGTFIGTGQLAGGLTLSVDLTNSAPSFGTIASPAIIQGGSENGTALFTPLALGQTFVGVTQPVGYTAPSHGHGIFDAPSTVIKVNVGQ